jgi:hypothetical protein
MRGTRRWLRIGTTAVVVTACVLGIGWLGRSTAPPDEIEAMVVAAEARLAACTRSREVAWGEAVEGKAFDHYVAASRLGTGLAFAVWDADEGRFRNGERRFTADEVGAMRAAWAPAMARLAHGARCRDATAPSPAEHGWMVPLFGARFEVEALLQEGRLHDAVQLWLDTGTFLLDHDWPGAIPRIWTGQTVAALPSDLAATLAHGTAVLEARVQAQPDLVAANAARLRLLLDGERPLTSWHWREVFDAWDHGLDPARRHLAAFARASRVLEDLPPGAPSHAERGAQWNALVQRATSDVDPLVAFEVQQARDRENRQRWCLTELRPLRIGLAARLGRPLPDLTDPWTGASLRVEHEDGAVVVHPAHPKARATRWPTR